MRALAGAVFVSGVRRDYSPEHHRFFIMVPHTISWFGGVDETSLPPLPVYEGRVNAAASPGALRSPERGEVGFQEFHESLAKHGETPPLPPSSSYRRKSASSKWLVERADADHGKVVGKSSTSIALAGLITLR